MPGDFEQTKLRNGLHVIAVPVPTAKVVSVVVGVDVGAADESPMQRGAAHFVEHMLFKGTEKRGLGQVDEEIESMGGAINAYTTHDETVYYATVREGRWRQALEILADMLQESRFESEDIAVERQVILEELRGVQEVPSEQFGQALMVKLWPQHPYGRPVGAFPQEVEKLEEAEIINFWRTWYRPQHMTVSVSGPVDPAEVLHAAEELFPSEASQVKRSRPDGSVSPSRRHVHLKRDYQESWVELGFPGPALHDQQAAVYMVLATLLGGSEASPLVSRLQYEQGLAHSAWASFAPRCDGGAFFVGCQAVRGKEAQAYQEIWAILQRIQDEGFSSEELARAKALMQGDRALSIQTVEAKALDALWNLQRFGDAAYGKDYLAQLESVSLAEVLGVAAKLFRVEASTRAVMVPEDGPGESLFIEPEAPSAPVAAPQQVQAETLRRRLSGGTTLLVERGEPGSMAAIRVLGLGGRLLESSARAGHARVWSAAVVCGAGLLTNRELADRLSLRGAGLAAAAYGPTMKLGIDCRPEVLDEAMEWLQILLESPHFAQEDLERLGREAMESLDGLVDRPAAIAWQRLNRSLFGTHPYGHPKLGTKRSLARITSRQMRGLHRKWCQPGNLVVAVVGTGEPERIADRLERLLQPLQERPVAEIQVPEITFPQQAQEHVVRAGRGQSQVILGWGTQGLGQPDRLALDLAASVMGSPAGRLFQSLRDHHGIAYDLDASHASALGGGCFALELTTESRRSEEARERLLEQIRGVAREGLGEEELERSKAQLVFSRLDSLQMPGSRASELAYWERCLGRGPEGVAEELARLEQIGASEVQCAVQRLLESSACVTVRSMPRKR